MAKRNHVARICARLNNGMVTSDAVIRPEKYKVLTAVEQVLAIRAKKIASCRQAFLIENKTRKIPFLSKPSLTTGRVSSRGHVGGKNETVAAVKNVIPSASTYDFHFVRKSTVPFHFKALNDVLADLEEKPVYDEEEMVYLEPVRPRISRKVLNVYARSRGGREEPGRRFARNKELRKGGRISLRRMPLLDPDFHEFDGNEFDMYQLAVAALFNARDERMVMV